MTTKDASTTSISDLAHRKSPRAWPALILVGIGLGLTASACTIESHDGHWDPTATGPQYSGSDTRCTSPGCRHQGPRPGGDADAGTTPPPTSPPPSSPPPTSPPTTDAGTPPVMNPTVGGTGEGGCRINAQCGGGRCVAGACQRRCTADSACGTGATCRDGFCQPADQPGTQCLYSTACGEGRVCINGFCHQRCPQPVSGDGGGTCSNAADRCDRGVCRPDTRPVPQCTASAQCPTGWMCVDAICRTACQDDSQCGPDCSGTVCSRGFCVMPEELTPPTCPPQPCGGSTCPGVCR